MPRALRTVTTTTRMGAHLVMGVLATMLVWTSPARGQAPREPVPARVEASQRLFEEGVALREAGDTEGAIDRLRRAHQLEPSDRTSYNLAAALVDGGRLVEAHRLLRRVVARSADLLVADAARSLLADVGPRIAQIDLRIAGASPAHRIFVDDAAIDVGPQGARGVALDPGAHRVEVRDAAGVVLARRDIELREGERVEIALRPVASPGSRAARERSAQAATVPPQAISTRAPEDAPSDETWVWVGLGAGAAVAIAIGAVAAGFALGGQSAGTPASGDLPPIVVRGRDG